MTYLSYVLIKSLCYFVGCTLPGGQGQKWRRLLGGKNTGESQCNLGPGWWQWHGRSGQTAKTFESRQKS